MDAVLLTWRWQNFFAVGLMIVAWYLLITIGSQVAIRLEGGKAASDG